MEVKTATTPIRQSVNKGATVFMKVIDPVCGMTVEPIRAAGESTFQEQTYYFCSQACKGKFDSEPPKYNQKTHELQHHI